MAQDRDSKKSPEEIYADEVVRQQLPFWADFANQVHAVQVPAGQSPAPTSVATSFDFSSIVPVAAGAVGLVLVLKLLHHHKGR